MADDKVTLIIPHWNRTEDLKKCLDSLEILTIQPKVIIIDDKSDNPPLINRKNTTVINLKEHIDTAAAKNVGIKLVESEYLWFIDSDTEVINPKMLEIGINELEKDSSLGAIGGEIRTFNGKYIVKEEILLNNFMSSDIYYELDKFHDKFAQHIPTNNFLTRTALVKEIGGFNPLLINGEDKLLSLQIRKRGYKLKLMREFCLVHHVSSFGRVLGQKAYDKVVKCHMLIYGIIYGIKGIFMFPIDTLIYFIKEYRNGKQRQQFFR